MLLIKLQVNYIFWYKNKKFTKNEVDQFSFRETHVTFLYQNFLLKIIKCKLKSNDTISNLIFHMIEH